MQTIAENLATYARSLQYADLPTTVVHAAKRILVDTLGCAFGGYASGPVKMARELAMTITSSQPATILCSGEKTSFDLAVFANDAMVRYLDFNDGYIGKGGGHPSDSIAALLSAAEIARGNGRDFILAMVLAYEVYCRFADAWDCKACGIDHVTIGGIASVVGVARLLDLSREEIIEAVNILVSGNVALNQTRAGDVSIWKGCAYAQANRNAVLAAQLAARGMTGPSPIFEGRDGFFKVVSREPFELAPFGGQGRPFGIMQCHLKRFPLGNFSQSVVTAVLEARTKVTDISDIAGVYVHVSQKALNAMADDLAKWFPRNRETADHSIPYTAAVALLYGTVDSSYFTEEYFVHDKKLLDLMGRIQCTTSEEADRRDAETFLCDVDVTTRGGERKSVRVEYHRGHWRNPMSDTEIEAKFRSLVGTKLSVARVETLLKCLWHLEDLSKIETLIHMTYINPTSPSNL